MTFLGIKTKGQFGTWNGHAAVVVFAPPVLSLLTLIWTAQPWIVMLVNAVLGTIGWCYFKWREKRDLKRHTEAGNADQHMEAGTHVTPRTDGEGDLLGPRTACAAYWMAFGLVGFAAWLAVGIG